jgi:type VII secretion protein EccE
VRQRLISARINTKVVVAAELIAGAAGLALSLALASWPTAFAVAALLAIAGCVMTVGGLSGWQWAHRLLVWVRHRHHHVELLDAVDVTVNQRKVGVIVDGHTVCTMIAVLGKPYIPTLLYSQHTKTLNMLPIIKIAEQMQRVGLPVDVDIVCEGSRTSRDNYAELYQTSLRGRPAAGQRTVTLVVRFDTRSSEVLPGLMWRKDPVAAAVAASQRITRELCQHNCRARLLTAEQMGAATAASLGGAEHIRASYREGWTNLQRAGKAFVTSYFFSSDDIVADTLDNVWTYQSDHTTLVIGLRRDPAGTVRASAMVRLATVQPLAAAPTLALNALPGRQWEALALTLPGQARLSLPSAPVTADLDAAVVPGSSGVLLGEFRNAMFLMPISDPAALTRIALRADDDKAVKQFIRRAAAAGEHVAVYDPAGAWTMTSRSPRIWVTRDVNARPPHQPTMVVHNGSGDGFPRARTMVRVGDGPSNGVPDIRIEHQGDRITVKTARFRTTVGSVSFRNEDAYLR